ncbi:MAG: hypothetical protein HY717_21620 [Planctomycetes bacterium]|nr:hypothetical protein [Planctomycetota bacterium]
MAEAKSIVIPVLDLHDLAAGNLTALLARLDPGKIASQLVPFLWKTSLPAIDDPLEFGKRLV